MPDRFNCGAFYVCDLLRDALSQIRPGRAAGIHLSFVFRDAWRERMDVPTKLRLALSRYLEPSLAARQSLPLLAAGLWDCLYSGVHAAVCRIFAPEFGDRFAARNDVLGIRRLHEFLARSAAGFIAIGMLTACWCAWKIRGRSLFGARLFWTWSLVTLFPLAGIFFSESLLLLTRLKPSWAMPIRSMLRHSVFWHLGFWEWTGAAAVFVFLCAAVFLTTTRTALPYADLARDDCTNARSNAVTM